MADPSKESEVRIVDRRWWARKEEPAEPEAPPAPKPTAGGDIEQQLAETREQLQAVLLEHRRATDEFEQARTRIRREVAREVERGQRMLLIEMLDVVDNLDRAIEAGAELSDGSSAETLLRGVELVRDQFMTKLAALDVYRLAAFGEVFDPLQHDAVSIAPAETPDQVGRVLAVVREGYLIRDEVLRPAAVVVGAQS